MPPISESQREQAISFAKQAETLHRASKAKPGADADLHEILRHLINAVKRITGDQSSLVE